MTVVHNDDLLVNFSPVEQAVLIRANKSCHVNANSIIRKMVAAPESSSGHAIFYITEVEHKTLKTLAEATDVNMKTILAGLKSSKRFRALR